MCLSHACVTPTLRRNYFLLIPRCYTITTASCLSQSHPLKTSYSWDAFRDVYAREPQLLLTNLVELIEFKKYNRAFKIVFRRFVSVNRGNKSPSKHVINFYGVYPLFPSSFSVDSRVHPLHANEGEAEEKRRHLQVTPSRICTAFKGNMNAIKYILHTLTGFTGIAIFKILFFFAFFPVFIFSFPSVHLSFVPLAFYLFSISFFLTTFLSSPFFSFHLSFHLSLSIFLFISFHLSSCLLLFLLA